MTKVIKKDGTLQEFNRDRVYSAMVASGLQPRLAEIASKEVQILLKLEDTVTLDFIHEEVEECLKRYDDISAKAYHDYRIERMRQQEYTSELMQGFLGIVTQKDEETLRENSNKASERIPTMRDLIAGQMVKQYTMKHLMPRPVASAHNDGTIHIHDTDYIGMPMVNCCLVDVIGMLEKGFKMGNAQIETPKSVTTAAAITAQIIAQVASHNYGGTTIANIDSVLEPYVMMTYEKHQATMFKYETSGSIVREFAREQTIKDIEAAIQGLEYEINTLHTSNGQTPFVTITFGRTTSWAGREIQKAILNQRIKGLGKDGITPVFPKLCFYREDGINSKEGDTNYDIKRLAVLCTSKRLYPDYLDVNRLEENIGGSPSPMGCRSFLPTHSSGTYDGRNNLGVVTVNLVRCALKANGDESVFWSELDKAVTLAKQALNIRVETCKQIQAKVAPILYMEGAFGLRTDNPEEYVFDRFFANGRATISLGYIGLYEVCKLIKGKGHHESTEARDFADKVLRELKAYTDSWKTFDGLAWSVYGTPAEGLCGRFAKLDKQKFGEVSDITDKDYYQNGGNVDVRAGINPMEKVMVEEFFPKVATGGFICYGELPSMRKNLEGLEQVIDFALDRVPYYAINTPTDICYECKFEGEFNVSTDGFYNCPSCGNHDPYKMHVIRRVSGYLTSPNHRPMPTGKTAEVLFRKKNL